MCRRQPNAGVRAVAALESRPIPLYGFRARQCRHLTHTSRVRSGTGLEMRESTNRPRRAFTLVELLVVIGIIAVLVGILLPTLANARESGRRTVCLSNLHQIQIMLVEYANRYKGGYCPIGCLKPGSTPLMMLNTTVNYSRNNVSAPICLGWLVQAGLGGKDGKVFYCPSETNPQWIWNWSEGGGLNDPLSANPWPFETNGSGHETRFAYASRPSVAWVMPPYSGTGTQAGKQLFVNSINKDCPMPKLKDFKTKAVVADANMTPLHLKSRHQKGVNVLYGTGAAKFVPKEHFMRTATGYASIPYPPSDVQVYNSGYNSYLLNDLIPSGPQAGSPLPNPTGLWIDYDRY